MKKMLAMALALTMTCGVMTACGNDDSSTKKDDSSTTTTTTTTAATTTTAPAEDSSSETDDGGEDVAQPKPIEDVADELLNNENPSITFTADSDLSWISMFNEEAVAKDADGNLLLNDDGTPKKVVPGTEGYSGDEAILEFSVAEVGGISMLKIDNMGQGNDVLYQVKEGDETYSDGTTEKQTWWFPKVRFDMGKLFEGQEDKLNEIFTVTMDLVVVSNAPAMSDDSAGTVAATETNMPGYAGGAFGTNNNEQWNGNAQEWSVNEWTSEWAYTELKIRPGIDAASGNAKSFAFDKDFETNYLTLMEWGIDHDVDLYIANITFLNENGEVITVD